MIPPLIPSLRERSKENLRFALNVGLPFVLPVYIEMSFSISNLCAPAYFYFIISMISIIILAIQNYGNSLEYCVGDYSCQVSSTFIVFMIKILVILLWTWILNLICKAGVTPLSWFLVLFPFIIMFIAIAYMFVM